MRVMDLSARSQLLPVEIEGAVAYELATSLYALSSDETLDTAESGGRWLAALRERTTPDLLQAIRQFDGGEGKIWTFLWSLVQHSAAPQDGAALLAYLEGADATDLRMRLLADHTSLGEQDQDAALLAGAARGDRIAQEHWLQRLVAACDEHGDGDVRILRAHLELEPEQDKAWLLSILHRWYEEVFRHQEAELAAILARDAEAKRRLARTQAPDRVIELATNGLRYVREAGIRRVLLFPSVVYRPWILICGYRDTKIFCYPAAEESLSGLPAPASARLLQMYKALADERRLQALQRLTAHSYSLQELADELGVGKSLMHHHLRTLRAAGLIRVSVGDRWRYELRTETIVEMPALLGAFLAGEPVAATGVQE